MLLAVLTVLAAATPEAAQTTAAPAPAPAAAPAAKAKDEMVCKTVQVTGSRFPKKECYSKAEYEEKRAQDQQHLRENQSGGLQRQ